MNIQIANILIENKSNDFHWCDETFELFQSYPGQLKNSQSWQMKSLTGSIPEFKDKELLFESEGSWASYCLSSTQEIILEQYCRTENGPRILQSLMKINPLLKEVCLYQGEDQNWGYPIDELFFLYTFSQNQSLLIHGCALAIDDRAYLFCGVSGAGKTTLAQLLEKDHKVNVLCDERNVITKDSHGNLFLSSTPWYGSGSYCKAATLPLGGIVVLDPSHKDLSLKPLAPSLALEEMLKVTFLPQFSPSGMENSVDMLLELIEKQGVHILSYDKEKVDISEFLFSDFFKKSSSQL